MIHADLFPDNVFFRDREVSGLIDFYFACTDFFAYDLAMCLNAWCFERRRQPQRDQGAAADRQLSQGAALSPDEIAALPMLARGSALRFLLTRLYDWLQPAGRRVGAAQGPARISAQAALPPHRHRSARLRSRCLRWARLIAAEVEIFTDGACSGNPGPGGWGAILRYAGIEKELSGGETETTNNRMEMMAAIAALEALKRPCRVRLYTDSQYLRDGITKWIHDWKKRGWRTADKKPVKNVDLWQRLEAAARRRTRSTGNGCAAMPVIPRTSAPTRSPAQPSPRAAEPWPSRARRLAEVPASYHDIAGLLAGHSFGALR